jgi:hypothetical protein
VIADIVAEVAPLWHERHRAALVARPRRRPWVLGQSTNWSSSTVSLATLVHLRHGATHDVLAYWFGV